MTELPLLNGFGIGSAFFISSDSETGSGMDFLRDKVNAAQAALDEINRRIDGVKNDKQRITFVFSRDFFKRNSCFGGGGIKSDVLSS